MSIIYVDADACPVREETKKVALRYGLKLIMVSNGGIRPSNNPMIEIVIVSHGADAADDWIVNNIEKNDIVITQDILLADRILKKEAKALSPVGKEFTLDNIGIKISMRELNQHLREIGEGGNFNAAFRPTDRSNFLQTLDLMAQRAQSKSL